MGNAAQAVMALQIGGQLAETGMKVAGQNQAWAAEDAMSEREAQVYERRAGQERASAQRRASQERERMKKLMSVQRAKAAASGAGLDGSFDDIFGDTAVQGKYNSDVRLWEGEEAAASLEERAALKRATAAASRGSRSAQRYGAVLSGVGGVAKSIGGGIKDGAFGDAEATLFYGSPGDDKGGGDPTEGARDPYVPYDPLWRNTKTKRYR